MCEKHCYGRVLGQWDSLKTRYKITTPLADGGRADSRTYVGYTDATDLREDWLEVGNSAAAAAELCQITVAGCHCIKTHDMSELFAIFLSSLPLCKEMGPIHTAALFHSLA